MDAKKIICVLCAGVKKKDGKWVSTGWEDEDFVDPKTGGLNYPGGTLRLEATKIFHEENPTALVFVPGGRGHDVPGDEPQRSDLSDMVELELIALGIPQDSIRKENRSNDTIEQLFALQYFVSKNPASQIVVVTGSYHAGRVRAMLDHFPGLAGRIPAPVTVLSAEEILLQNDKAKWERIIQRVERHPRTKEIRAKEEEGINKLLTNRYQKRLLAIEDAKGLRFIGPGQPVFIVAEMSGNHNQFYEKALRIIDAAAEAQADAVKLQTYTAETITIDADNEYFRVKVGNTWRGKTLYELYREAYTPWDWQPKLKAYAQKKGLIFFSTPFDSSAVDFLEQMDVPLYKVASFEIVDIPLLEKIGQTRKPVIISRGMASEEEIELAIKTLKDNGTPQVAVLHCISSYPAEPEEMNLAIIPDLAEKFEVVAGLSDHTLGIVVPVAGVALGASIIEKHVTLARSDGGPDAAFSLEPAELKQMVQAIRAAGSAIGQPTYGAGIAESENVVFRKSLMVVEDIKAGEKLTQRNVRVIRPGYGLAPKFYKEILGRTAAQNISRGTPLSWELIK